MMNAPGIQSLFRQITANPAAMQSLVTPDSMARMAQMMGQNPEMMQQMLQSMAGMGGAGITDQLQGQLPNILNMVRRISSSAASPLPFVSDGKPTSSSVSIQPKVTS